MLLKMGPVIYACCTDNTRRKKELCIILPHMLAAVYIPWVMGRVGMKSAKENMFLKVWVLYNRMFSSRCLLF
jgi:hypothetical protein